MHDMMTRMWPSREADIFELEHLGDSGKPALIGWGTRAHRVQSDHSHDHGQAHEHGAPFPVSIPHTILPAVLTVLTAVAVSGAILAIRNKLR